MKTDDVYSIYFDEFSIEMHVNFTHSVEQTFEFQKEGDENDLIYIAGEIFLFANQSQKLIIEEFNVGNISIILNEMMRSIIHVDEPALAEELIPIGGWGPWVQSYWNKIENDCCTQKDEEIYKSLKKFIFLEGLCGRIGIYSYGGAMVLEVSSPSKATSKDTPVNVWSVFKAENLNAELLKLSKIIKSDVRTHLEKYQN